ALVGDREGRDPDIVFRAEGRQDRVESGGLEVDLHAELPSDGIGDVDVDAFGSLAVLLAQEFPGSIGGIGADGDRAAALDLLGKARRQRLVDLDARRIEPFFGYGSIGDECHRKGGDQRRPDSRVQHEISPSCACAMRSYPGFMAPDPLDRRRNYGNSSQVSPILSWWHSIPKSYCLLDVLRRLTACFLVSIEELTIVLVTGAGTTRPKHSWDDAMLVSPPLGASIVIPAIARSCS